MAEVQAHGNIFEDIIIKKLTGKSKKEYDALKKGGYTSAMDLVKGLLVDEDYSIKTTGSNVVDCGDILSRMKEKRYIMIVGQWRQLDPTTKLIHTIYCFNVKSKDYKKLWGKNKIKVTERYVKKVKSVDHKDRSQIEDYRTPEKQDAWLEELDWDFDALLRPNPKVNSQQSRVQCSFKIDRMIAAGVEYMKKDNMNIVIKKSPPRNKK